MACCGVIHCILVCDAKLLKKSSVPFHVITIVNILTFSKHVFINIILDEEQNPEDQFQTHVVRYQGQQGQWHL